MNEPSWSDGDWDEPHIFAIDENNQLKSFKSPAEYASYMAGIKDRGEARHEQIAHAAEELLEALTPDQLDALNFIVQRAATGSAPYLVGRIAGLKKVKAKICPICDKNHDEEFKKLTGNVEAKPPSKAMTDLYKTYSSSTPEEINKRLLNMVEYNLEPTPRNEGPSPYRCKNCHYPYPSLEDRMVKAPDDCEGCIQKAKFG